MQTTQSLAIKSVLFSDIGGELSRNFNHSLVVADQLAVLQRSFAVLFAPATRVVLHFVVGLFFKSFE